MIIKIAKLETILTKFTQRIVHYHRKKSKEEKKQSIQGEIEKITPETEINPLQIYITSNNRVL